MHSHGRIIDRVEDIEEGAAWLARAEPRFAAALEVTGTPPLRRSPDGFAALLRAIVAQQVSTASAHAIWARVAAAGLADPARLRAADEVTLRAAGLSRPKMRYMQALAAADIDYDALRQLPDETVVATLTQVPGIGVWTAEVYALINLGRADVFAPGDLALKEAARMIFGLDGRPGEPELRGMAAAWSPWRGVAARLMWAYYRVAKYREGI